MPPHDRFFKTLFRVFFRELLLLVDPGLASRISPEAKIEYRDQELLPDSPETERRVVDLLAAIPADAEGDAFMIHFEIERRAGPSIGRRLWEYSIRLRGRYPEPLISLVVFLRGGPAGAVWQTHTEGAAGHHVATFRYLSFGLSKLPAERLLALPVSLAWGLAALADPGELGRAQVKLEALRRIAEATLSERQRFLLVNCVETYLPLNGRDAEEYASAISARKALEIHAMQLTWADKLEAKGFVQGRKEGRQEGREEGREEGLQAAAVRLRKTVLRLLGQRFGTVPPTVRRRLTSLRSVDELTSVADRILVARSFEDLGLGE